MKDQWKTKKQRIDKHESLRERVAESGNNKTEQLIVNEAPQQPELIERENTLAFEHERLVSILDCSPVSSFVIDRERRVTAWNKVNELLTGITKNQILGKPLDLSPLFKGRTPPGLAVLVLEMSDEEILKRYGHGGVSKSKIHPEAFESTSSIWIKGKEHIMAIRATRLRDPAGNVIGAIQCAEDITEQKRAEEALRESEELYRTALESSNDGVAIIEDGRYVYLNLKLLDTLGRERDEIMGRAVGLTMHPDDRAMALAYYDRYRKGLPTPDHFEVRVYKPDGTTIYAEVTAVEVIFKGKKSLLIYFRDITERKRAEAELIRTRNELELRVRERTAALENANDQLRSVHAKLIAAQEDERRRLAGDLHDSIGQTLAALKYGIETVLVKKETGDLAGAFKHLELFIPTLQNSIEEIRSIYRGLRPPVLDDLGLLAALEWFCREFQKQHLDLHLILKTGVEEEEISDILKITIFRIIQEALNNVVKHSGAKRVQLSLIKNRNSVELVIQDDGRGFNLDSLAAPDSRAGLGLAGMRERVEVTGGSFSIKSARERGTRLRMCWPMTAASPGFSQGGTRECRKCTS